MDLLQLTATKATDQSTQRLMLRLPLWTLSISMMLLVACGSEPNEPVSSEGPVASAKSETTPKTENKSASSDCEVDADFTLRVVYNVINTYEREEHRKLGAPAQAKGIVRRELLMRDKARLVRRTGKTYRDDPEDIRKSDDEWENEIAGIQSNGEYMTRAAQWKHERSLIKKVVLAIDWVDYRAPPGQYSYRYGLDPMVPLQGEKWREDDSDPWDSDEAKEVLSEPGMLTIDPRVMDGVTVSTATYAGHECEMLRKVTSDRTHETCFAVFDGRSVVLHGMDKSAKGSMTQTAESVELGLCVTDSMLAAPGRVRLEEDDW